MLRTYRMCNSTVGFSKYKFYNKLLVGVTLLRISKKKKEKKSQVTPSVTLVKLRLLYTVDF